MEKQIQILTSELSQLKNNHNKLTKLWNQKSFTTTKPNHQILIDTLTTKYLIEYSNKWKHILTNSKKRYKRFWTKQRRGKRGPKRRYTANTRNHASINYIRKAIYRTQRYRNDPLNNAVDLSKKTSKKTLTYNEFKLLKKGHKRLKLLFKPGKI